MSALVCGSLLACPLPTAPAQTQTMNVDVRLVVVPVTVRDTKEHLLRSLNKEDFTLTVDGKPQSIRYFDREDDLPLTLGLLVDVSGSQRTVLDSERTASSAFLDNMLQPERDKAFIVQFGHQADLLADVTGSVPRLQAALEKIDSSRQDRPQFSGDDRSDSGNSSPSNDNGGYGGYGGRRHGGYGGGRSGGGNSGGGTLLYDAVYLASTEVVAKPAKDAKPTGAGRKALILLTDGEDRGSRESVAEAIEAAQRADFTVYAIYYKGEDRGGSGNGFPGGFHGGHGGGFPGGGRGAGGGREHVDGKKILERMAGETGGRVYEVSKKRALPDIYKEIAEELRSQYRLGFSPANIDEGYHRVVVDTPKQKKAVLQFRDGYYTGAK